MLKDQKKQEKILEEEKEQKMKEKKIQVEI